MNLDDKGIKSNLIGEMQARPQTSRLTKQFKLSKGVHSSSSIRSPNTFSHKVIQSEPVPKAFDPPMIFPPNLTKVLINWGKELEKHE